MKDSSESGVFENCIGVLQFTSSLIDSANTIKFCWIDLKLNRLSDFNVNLVKPAINGINIIYIRLHIRNFIEFNGALQ